MPLSIATVGGITIDNIINANGLVGLRFPGGNGIYSAAGVRLWNREAIAVGLAPEDYMGSWIDSLNTHGITTEGVFRRRDLMAGRKEWFIYNQDGKRDDLIFISFKELEGASIQLPEDWMYAVRLDDELLERLIVELRNNKNKLYVNVPYIDLEARRSDYIHNLQTLDGVHIAPGLFDFQLNLTNILCEKTSVISLDPGHYGNQINLDDLARLLKKVTIFAPSEREVEEILGPVREQVAARLFGEIGAKIVVIKRGANGCLVYNSLTKKFFDVPIFHTTVVDPTGCGDAFCGGFLAGYLETEDCYLAAMYGTVAASFAIEGFGSHHLLRFNRSDGETRVNILEGRRLD